MITTTSEFKELTNSAAMDIEGGLSIANPGPGPKMTDYDLTTPMGMMQYKAAYSVWLGKCSAINNVFYNKIMR